MISKGPQVIQSAVSPNLPTSITINQGSPELLSSGFFPLPELLWQSPSIGSIGHKRGKKRGQYMGLVMSFPGILLLWTGGSGSKGGSQGPAPNPMTNATQLANLSISAETQNDTFSSNLNQDIVTLAGVSVPTPVGNLESREVMGFRFSSF